MIDLTNQKFGRLTAKRKGEHRYGHITWVCECDCGKEVSVVANSLRRNLSKSCGCLNREIISAAKKHGMYGTPIYAAWHHMKQRCLNPKDKRYSAYGGRGIKVCERWLDCQNFMEDMLPSYRDGLTIERKDVNGNYQPDNCCWITLSEQGHNRRSSIFIEYKGERLNLAQWAKRFNIHPDTFSRRIREAWSFEEAISTPVLGRKS